MDKLTVGQTVFLLPIGNNARGKKDIQLEAANVAKVGRKYFQVTRGGRTCPVEFHIDGLYEKSGDHCPGWRLYLSEQEYSDEKESSNILRFISSPYGSKLNMLPVEKLRIIKQWCEGAGNGQ